MTVVGAPHSDSVDKTSAEGPASITRKRSSSMAPVARTLPKDLQAAPLTTEPQQATAKVTASLNKARDAGVPDAPSRPSLWKRLLSPENVMMAGAVLIALSGGAAAMPVFCLVMVMVIGNSGDSTASHGVGPAIASFGDPTPPMPKAGKDDTALTEQRHRDSVAQQQLLDQLPDPSSAMGSMTRAEQDSADYNVEHPQHAWQREEVSQQARLFAELASKQAASAPSIPPTATKASLEQAPAQSQVQRSIAPAMPAPLTAVQQLIARCTSGNPDDRVEPLTELLNGLTDLATERSIRLATAEAVVHALAGLSATDLDHALNSWPVELLYLAHGEAKTDQSNAELVKQISVRLVERAGDVTQERVATLLDRGRQVTQGELMHSLGQLGDSIKLLSDTAYTNFDDLALAATSKLVQDPGTPVVAAMNVNGNHWVSVIAQRQGDGIRFDLLDSNHAGPARPEWAKAAARSGHGEIGFVGMALQTKHSNACGPLQAAFSRHLARKADADGHIEVAAALAEWKAGWDKLSVPEQQLSVAATRAQMMGGLENQTTQLILDANQWV
jgi:hypothetical protein